MKLSIISLVAVAAVTAACSFPTQREKAMVHSCTPYQLKQGYCEHRAALDYTGYGQYSALSHQPALNDYSSNPTKRTPPKKH